MLFNSYSFLLLFLPLTLLAFYTLLLKRGLLPAMTALLVASLLFYAWWNIANLPVLIASILVNYAIANRMAQAMGKARKRWFILGIVFNLALLGVFKYTGFATGNLHAAGLDVPLLRIALPLGISFFTFQQIAFLRGVYEVTDYVPNFLRYATFISFFPHLIAGPILYHREIQPQFGHLKREIPWRSVTIGIALLSIGLFKKVMLADPIGALADPLYAPGVQLSFLQGWAAAFLYGFQLYFDFSGYSDMAIGLAHLFGIGFPRNFDSPYKSASIAEFWRRWHITLSHFLRDFLYIPLGGSRNGIVRTLLNLVITMGLGGLWHGASWNFMLWGLLHGAYLALHALWQKLGFALPRLLGWALTLPTVMAAWVLFRAPDLAAAGHIYHAMFHVTGLDYAPLHHALPWLAASFIIVLLLPNAVSWAREEASVAWFGERLSRFSSFLPLPHWNAALFALFAVALLHVSRLTTFLYFNF